MDETLFFSTKSIGTSTRQNRKPQTLLDAVRHNRRLIHAEASSFGRIDPARSHLNEVLAGPGSPDGVVALAQSLMSAVGYAPDRRDYTQAFELVFSLPAVTTVNTTLFFNSCMAWTTEKFGDDVILSADIHRDEATPHMHVLVSPIAGGRYLGTKLITRMELDALRKSFAEMALGYGLREPVRKLYGAQRDGVAKLVIGQLEASHDPILQSALWPMVKHDITSKPGRYASSLGIDIPAASVKAKRVKTLAELAVSPGKGPRHERPAKAIGFKDSKAEGQCKPIGIESASPASAMKAMGLGRDRDMPMLKNLDHTCVLVSPKTLTVSARSAWHGTYCRLTAKPVGLFISLIPGSRAIPEVPVAATSTGANRSHLTTTRVKDVDLDAGAWDSERGEFVPSVSPTTLSETTRSGHRVQAAGDTYVERDTYQPDFSESEAYPWQD